MLSPNVKRKTSRNLPKSKFNPEEDQKLLEIIRLVGHTDWNKVSLLMETRNPELTKAGWGPNDDRRLEEVVAEVGLGWHKVAKYFPNRAENFLRNRWQLLQRRHLKFEKLHIPCVPPFEFYVPAKQDTPPKVQLPSLQMFPFSPIPRPLPMLSPIILPAITTP